MVTTRLDIYKHTVHWPRHVCNQTHTHSLLQAMNVEWLSLNLALCYDVVQCWLVANAIAKLKYGQTGHSNWSSLDLLTTAPNISPHDWKSRYVTQILKLRCWRCMHVMIWIWSFMTRCSKQRNRPRNILHINMMYPKGSTGRIIGTYLKRSQNILRPWITKYL